MWRVVLFSIVFTGAAWAGTCKGLSPCKECANCRQCGYCNSGKGSCSVKRAEADRERERLKQAKQSRP